ncbi:MAG: ABC transporter ATP-binding protein [Candidatus Omnitrophica bacterium]|nr:ABC transporter ATP-binding protein [Candidatus Omnitrophota bacterium]
MIEIADLYKSFDAKPVLEGLSLTIRKGETLVIIGRSGCGKSVLLKLIMGLLKSDSGRIVVNGQDVSMLSDEQLNKLRTRIGMLFQGGALFDSMTVGDNVGFSLIEHSDLPAPRIRQIVREKLRMVGLAGIEHLDPSQLSGGMKKRVALARAICQDPEIMFYDEPTTGLDPIMAEAINELIVNLNTTLKVTSIVVTHDMHSAYKVGNRIAMLFEGKIIGLGTPDEIKHSKDPIVQQFIHGSARGPITERAERRFLIDKEAGHE